MSATVLTRYCFFFLLLLLFLLHVFLSCVLSLICEAVLCLELVFAELGQAHYKFNFLLFIIMFIMLPCSQRALILVPTYEKFRRDCRGLVVAMASVYIVCVQISSFMLRSDQRFHHVYS